MPGRSRRHASAAPCGSSAILCRRSWNRAPTSREAGGVNAREKAIRAHRVLLNCGMLSYFQERGISSETVRAAWVGYDGASGAFTYPCIARGGGLLGIHFKTKGRDEHGKRRQWWGAYAEDLPAKGHGKKPDDPAKIIPFGLETLRDLKPGSLVLLCCGEEDALSVRQAGYMALSQPGAGFLEPVYAKEFKGFEVVVFYDAGEEHEARLDALKLLEAGAKDTRVVQWPKDEPHGSDVNGKLVEDPEGFERWLAERITSAKPPASVVTDVGEREGEPDIYVASLPSLPAWPTLPEEALCGLLGDIVGEIEPHTEADRVAVLFRPLVGFRNAIGSRA